MPIWKRKRVQFIQPSDELLNWAHNNPSKQVFCLQQTGEIFADYKSYCARLTFYRTKQFQCEVTGKGGMDYFQAIESEQQEARNLQARFPERLKEAVLSAVQWQIIGRLDNLVDTIYERFKDRFFKDEKVIVDLKEGKDDKYWARVLAVFPPAHVSQHEPHRVGGTLRLDNEQAVKEDDPRHYAYQIQILEEVAGSSSSQSASKNTEDKSLKWKGCYMEVHCSKLSRDRLTFSKSLLRKFLRDSVDRESTVASPWIVKSNLARQYGLETEMPDEVKKGIEDCRKGESEKRKKVWEDKDGPPSKKQKKATEAKAVLESNQSQVQANQDLDMKKKKPIKYPIEDLDVERTEKEKKQGVKKRPLPKLGVPFGDDFEQFFMSWCFLQTFGAALNLAPFSLEQFEQAIKHSDSSNCFLIAEVHTCLAYNIRQVSGQRNTASTSLYEMYQDGVISNDGTVVSIEELLTALAARGGNWERLPLRNTPNREGWQDAIIGLVKDHATPRNFPRLKEVLTHLLLHSSLKGAQDAYESSHAFLTASYNSMPSVDKIALLAFLCDRSVSSKSVRSFMENCEERLTTLRKEKAEINREKKRYLEQTQVLNGDVNGNTMIPAEINGDGDDEIPAPSTSKPESDDESEHKTHSGSENGIRSARSTPGSISKSKKGVVRLKVSGLAQQRKAEREKAAQERATLAEIRRLEDEVSKLDIRLRSVDQEFRSVTMSTRIRPIGKDRFFYRYWWLDGLGGSTCSTGHLYIQCPSELDQEVLDKREAAGEGVREKMLQELGGSYLGGSSGQWGFYSTADEFDEFVASLIHKGKRESHLKNTINLLRPNIIASFERTAINTSQGTRGIDTRRSSRHNATEREGIQESYLHWSNSRAPNVSAVALQ